MARLGRAELIAAVGGVLLVAGLFLPWYRTDPDNPNAVIDGETGSLSGWEVHPVLRWLLLAAASAPFILIWIVIREHELSWPRGELTAVIGLTAATLVFYIGIIDRPGEPSGQIELEIGWYGAMLGSVLSAAGGALRSSESERRRKPPGVL